MDPFVKKTINKCLRDYGAEKCQSRYQYTCNCTNNYIGSTKHCFRNRVEENLRPTTSQKPSSITLHRRDCSELENGFKIINHGSYMVDTRIKEGLSIHQLKATLNNKDELIYWLGNLNNISLS